MCVWRPNCYQIKNQCTSTLCPTVETKETSFNTAAEKEIRELTNCLHCNNNSYTDNYGLLGRRSLPSNVALAHCKTDAGGAKWY